MSYKQIVSYCSFAKVVVVFFLQSIWKFLHDFKDLELYHCDK